MYRVSKTHLESLPSSHFFSRGPGREGVLACSKLRGGEVLNKAVQRLQEAGGRNLSNVGASPIEVRFRAGLDSMARWSDCQGLEQGNLDSTSQ
jgi:hypothetical protein